MTTYERCPECNSENSWKCTWCNEEGYVEIDDDKLIPEPKPELFTVVVVFADGTQANYSPATGYSPLGDNWSSYFIQVRETQVYLNFSEVQSIEISPHGERSE